MAWNKHNNNKFSKREFMSDRPKTNSGLPSKVETTTADTLVRKTFKDLRYNGVISTKADPLTTATTASQPYALLAATNPVIDGVYPGDPNLDGNMMIQIMNNTNSKLMNNFDSGSLVLNLNYLYLCYETLAHANANNIPYAANQYMGNAINEALSRTNSEMMTNLAFAQYGVRTPHPDMDNNNLSYVVLLYQTMLINVATVLGKYMQLMSLEDELIDMGYNREAYFIIQIFGFLKKKAFVQTLNALSSFIQGEYFDKDWYRQINTLTLVPSRKSRSIRDPLLTISGIHRVPTVEVFANGNVPDDPTNITGRLFATQDYHTAVDGTDMTFIEIVTELIQALDQRAILHWARNNYTDVDFEPAQQYINRLVDLIEGLTRIMSRFSADMTDVRTYLDKMNQIGLNYWTQGTFFDVSAVNKTRPSYNLIVANVFRAYLSSPHEIEWNPDIMRWTMFSYWDEFTGINTFDKFNGGAFLTFSVRDITVPQGVEMHDSIMLIPKLFDVVEDSVIMEARTGLAVPFGYIEMDVNTVNNNFVLSRLLPLANSGGPIRMPHVDVADNVNAPGVASAAYETLQTVFGLGQITYQQGGQARQNYALDRDMVSLIDIQMQDVSNAMISFVRAYAPFKVWVANGNRTIGFG